MSSTHRVHLIFDYVDDHPIKQRFQLRPGEVVHQTRRSIDLAREADNEDLRRKVPSFIIIGAQVSVVNFLFIYFYIFAQIVRLLSTASTLHLLLLLIEMWHHFDV